MRATAHLFHYQERAKVVKIRLATPGRAGRAYRAVNIEPGAEDGRVAKPSGNLPGQSAGGSNATDFALTVDTIAIDRSVQMFRLKQALREHFQRDASSSFGAIFWIGIVRRIGAPLPFQPERARMLRVQVVFNLKAHVVGKCLRALPNQQVVVSVLHHGFGDEGRCSHAFERAHRAGALLRPVHA